MGERDVLDLDQPKQHVGSVTTGVDLLDPHDGGHVWNPPRMDMEYRRDRHVDVRPVKALALRRRAQRSHPRQGVQHELSVTEIHALWEPRRAGRIEGRGTCVLVEV